MAHLTKKQQQTIKRMQQLRAQGLSFRAIEQRMMKTLGLKKSGHGTAAYRLLKVAA